MKHAGPKALEAIEALLEELRTIPGLTERKRGIFYRGAAAFLHFQEDPRDVRRFAPRCGLRVNTRSEIAGLLRAARAEARRPSSA